MQWQGCSVCAGPLSFVLPQRELECHRYSYRNDYPLSRLPLLSSTALLQHQKPIQCIFLSVQTSYIVSKGMGLHAGAVFLSGSWGSFCLVPLLFSCGGARQGRQAYAFQVSHSLHLLFLLCCTRGAHCSQPMSMLCDLSWRRPVLPAIVRDAIAVAEMAQYSSGVPGDRHHLKGVPLLMGDDVSLVNITISQKPDGSDWLWGQGSSGKVFHHHYCCH